MSFIMINCHHISLTVINCYSFQLMVHYKVVYIFVKRFVLVFYISDVLLLVVCTIFKNSDSLFYNMFFLVVFFCCFFSIFTVIFQMYSLYFFLL